MRPAEIAKIDLPQILLMRTLSDEEEEIIQIWKDVNPLGSPIHNKFTDDKKSSYGTLL